MRVVSQLQPTVLSIQIFNNLKTTIFLCAVAPTHAIIVVDG
jgi:hypothetical protein